MSLNKVLMALVLLVVVLATAHARPAELSSPGLDQAGSLCSSCSCSGTVCTRFEQKVGGCPFVCGNPCVCTRSIPPRCSCSYKVETCSPRACPRAETTLADLATVTP